MCAACNMKEIKEAYNKVQVKVKSGWSVMTFDDVPSMCYRIFAYDKSNMENQVKCSIPYRLVSKILKGNKLVLAEFTKLEHQINDARSGIRKIFHAMLHGENKDTHDKGTAD